MKLKIKFLLILCLLALGVGFITYAVSVINANALITQQAADHAIEIKKKFDNLTQQNIQMLSLAAHFFVTNRETQNAFIARDREKLYRETLHVFEESREKYGVTHMNFIDPNGVVFLRMQDPETYGDSPERSVVRDAIASQKIQSSLELGKNSFALRIARPYYSDNNLIGYIEIARDMENFLDALTYETTNSFAILGKKEFLNRDDYIISMRKKNEPDMWDALPDDVTLAKTDNITDDCLKIQSSDTYAHSDRNFPEIIYLDKTYLCTNFPIADSTGHRIATVIAAHDITPIISIHHRIVSIEIAIMIVVFVVFLVFFYMTLHRFVIMPTEKLTYAASAVAAGDLTKRVSYISKDEIGDLTKFFNIMVTRLSEYQHTITEESRKLQRHIREITEKNIQLDESHHATMRALDQAKAAKMLAETYARDLNKFKMAADSTSDSVVITDAAGTIIYVNAVTEKISGLTYQQLHKNKNGIGIFWGEETDNEQFHQICERVKQKKSFSYTIKIIDSHKTERYTSTSITPILNDHQEIIFVVSIGKDITKEKEIENAKDNFISLVSHQLRTPLTSIKWLLELLFDAKTGRINKKQKEFLTAAYASAHRLSLLVNDILSINRIEMNRIRVILTPTDPVKLLSEICQEQRDSYTKKSLRVIMPSVRSIPKIDMDPILIRQVIGNILSNAIKYTPENGTITCEIEIKNDHISFMVTDTGIGIPPHEQGHIFERFFRASNASINGADGTGLGLFIAKMIVEICGGTIGFTSKLHHGTTVQFELPLKKHLQM